MSNVPSTQRSDTAATPRRRVVHPSADILEYQDRYQIVADLPGVAEDDVDVTIERNFLSIRARSASANPDGLRPIWNEYDEVDYERRFTLGTGIDRDAVAARMHDGVLELDLPKTDDRQPRRITVSAN